MITSWALDDWSANTSSLSLRYLCRPHRCSIQAPLIFCIDPATLGRQKSAVISNLQLGGAGRQGVASDFA